MKLIRKHWPDEYRAFPGNVEIRREVLLDWAKMDSQRIDDAFTLLQQMVHDGACDAQGHEYEIEDMMVAIHFAITEGPDFEVGDELSHQAIRLCRALGIEHLEQTGVDYDAG